MIEACTAMVARILGRRMGVEGRTARTAIEAGVGVVIERSMEAGTEVAVGVVVVETAAVPVSAVETYAEVAEAVVDAAVVADAAAP